MTITSYEHHGKSVFVDEALKGKHREHCLCYRCGKFDRIDHEQGSAPVRHCPIAQATYENCVRFGIVTPMYECPEFEGK